LSGADVTGHRRRRSAVRKKTTLPIGKGVLAVLAAAWALASGTIGAVLQSQVLARWFADDQAAEISSIDYQVSTFGAYLDKTRTPRAGWKPQDLRRKGLAVFSTVKATGLSAHPLQVRGGLLSLNNGRQELFTLEAYTRGYDLTPHAGKTDTKQANVWIALPTRPGKYAIVERVYESNGGELRGRQVGGPFKLDAHGRLTSAGK
jgi:hypothetical protein